MKGVFEALAKDLSMYSNDIFLVKLKVVLISHAFHLVLLYRLGSQLTKVPVIGGVIRVVFEYVIRVLYASDISLKSRIEPGLMIVHGHDIVIGGNVRIGSRCKILNGVTLGNKDTESSINAQPVVGDNVVIGSGAKILGKIKIGDNVLIGANSVVLKSTPDNVTIAGIPAKVVAEHTI